MEIPQKVFGAFDNVFHDYSMSGLQKKCKKKRISQWLFEIIHIICFEMHMDRPDKSEDTFGIRY